MPTSRAAVAVATSRGGWHHTGRRRGRPCTATAGTLHTIPGVIRNSQQTSSGRICPRSTGQHRLPLHHASRVLLGLHLRKAPLPSPRKQRLDCFRNPSLQSHTQSRLNVKIEANKANGIGPIESSPTKKLVPSTKVQHLIIKPSATYGKHT